jgi:hypothetical protein
MGSGRFGTNHATRWTRESPSAMSRYPSLLTHVGMAARSARVPTLHDERSTGWQRVHEGLKATPDRPTVLQVVETWINLIRTLPEQIHDKLDVEDLDTDGEDHLADVVRYGLMALEAASPRERETPLTCGLGKAAVSEKRHWSETLTPEEIAEYEARAVHELGPACAHWLATGENG